MEGLLLRGSTVKLLLVCLALSGSALFGSALFAAPASAAPYTEVDAAIDSVGLPPIFHTIAWRESGDNPYVVNPYSGACGPFQFLPSTAWEYGYTCYELQDPYIAADAAYELWWDYGLSPWALTAY